MLNPQILQEIESVPAENLDELCELIHRFCLKFEASTPRLPRQPGLLEGQLGEAFFEPLPEAALQRWG
jgi:hypothetical protein